MVRLTIHFKKFPKAVVRGKERIFNTKTFGRITRKEALRILGGYDKRNIKRYQITPYNA